MKWNEFSNEKIGEKAFTAKHKSGLEIVVVPKERSHTFAVLGVNFGASDRKFRIKGETEWTELPEGVAHFLEHKMFEDKDGVDAFSRFAATGANANAFTSAEDTCYLFSCSEKEEENLRILLDFVLHPYFSDATVAKEQGIIGEEIDMDADQPGTAAYYGLMECLFHSHPVRDRICGSRESIAKITPGLLYRCTDCFYRPDNMVLAVCGKMTKEQVEAICDEMLPKKSPFPGVERWFPDEPDTVCKEKFESESEIAQSLVEIGFKVPPAKSTAEALKQSAANEISSAMLFGWSGEFYNRLYEEGLISDRFGGGFVQSVRLGFAYITVSAYCDKPEELQNAVCNEIEKRRKTYFTKEEFETAKKVVYTNKLFSMDSPEETAFSWVEHRFLGKDYLEYVTSLSEVTYEEARAIFKKTFKTDQKALCVVSPKGGKL